jgi:hypothetical protein
MLAEWIATLARTAECIEWAARGKTYMQVMECARSRRKLSQLGIDRSGARNWASSDICHANLEHPPISTHALTWAICVADSFSRTLADLGRARMPDNDKPYWTYQDFADYWGLSDVLENECCHF